MEISYVVTYVISSKLFFLVGAPCLALIYFLKTILFRKKLEFDDEMRNSFYFYFAIRLILLEYLLLLVSITLMPIFSSPVEANYNHYAFNFSLFDGWTPMIMRNEDPILHLCGSFLAFLPISMLLVLSHYKHLLHSTSCFALSILLIVAIMYLQIAEFKYGLAAASRSVYFTDLVFYALGSLAGIISGQLCRKLLKPSLVTG